MSDAAADRVVYRNPLVSTLLGVGLGLVNLLLILLVCGFAGRDNAFAVILLVITLLSVFLQVRGIRFAVIADDRLIVRNLVRTYKVPWQDIASFEMPPDRVVATAAFARLKSGRKVPLAAITMNRNFQDYDKLRGQLQVLDQIRRRRTGLQADG